MSGQNVSLDHLCIKQLFCKYTNIDNPLIDWIDWKGYLNSVTLLAETTLFNG